MKRGDVYLADLNPTRGSEQAGVRPVIIVQRNVFMRLTRTVVAVPLTTNLSRIQMPGTIVIPAGTGGLTQDSVALCYQVTTLAQERLIRRLGELPPDVLQEIGDGLSYTLQI